METISLLEMQTRLEKLKNYMRVFVQDAEVWDLWAKERMELEARIEAWGKESGVQYRIM